MRPIRRSAPAKPATVSGETQNQIAAAKESATEQAAAAITPPPSKASTAASTKASTPEPIKKAEKSAASTEPVKKADTTASAVKEAAKKVETKAAESKVASLTDGALSQKWRVQVGAVRSEAAAEKEWARIVGKNKNLLGDLTLQVQKVDVTGKGTFFRIRGGPVTDKAKATGLCAKLKANKIPCIPVRPGA